eukprot:837872-Alexandrium_andersonii.AAC.1
MSASLVGSEMCIRDRHTTMPECWAELHEEVLEEPPPSTPRGGAERGDNACLLYTSDAADDM